MKKIFFLAGISVAVIFSACKKTEQYKTDAISDFAPLAVGKYITYRLDSLIFADNLIPKDTVISYQVNYLVQDTTTDNLGRKVFIIRRYIRKTAADEWVVDNTFTAVNTGTAYEFTENNLRFLKLELPIKNGFSWPGNSYIDTDPAYSDVSYYDGWNYSYDSLNTPLTLGNITVDSTLKVNEANQTSGGDINDPSTLFAEYDFSVSNYGRGIGLIYHRFIHEEYQNPDGNDGYKLGYGITLTMIDHN